MRTPAYTSSPPGELNSLPGWGFSGLWAMSSYLEGGGRRAVVNALAAEPRHCNGLQARAAGGFAAQTLTPPPGTQPAPAPGGLQRPLHGWGVPSHECDDLVGVYSSAPQDLVGLCGVMSGKSLGVSITAPSGCSGKGEDWRPAVRASGAFCCPTHVRHVRLVPIIAPACAACDQHRPKIACCRVCSHARATVAIRRQGHTASAAMQARLGMPQRHWQPAREELRAWDARTQTHRPPPRQRPEASLAAPPQVSRVHDALSEQLSKADKQFWSACLAEQLGKPKPVPTNAN